MTAGRSARNKVITYSHFLPRIDLMPGFVTHGKPPPLSDPRFHPPRAPVAGGSIPRFTFTDTATSNRQVTVGGVAYINNAFGYPSESWMTSKDLVVCINEVLRFVDYGLYHTGERTISLQPPSRNSSLARGLNMTTIHEAIGPPRNMPPYPRDLLSDGEAEAGAALLFLPRPGRRYLVHAGNWCGTVLVALCGPIDPGSGSFPTTRLCAVPRQSIQIAEEPARSLVVVQYLSHTNSLIVMAVTERPGAGRRCGEHPRPPSLDSTSPIGYFRPAGSGALATVQSPQQQDRFFFEYWTFKEAYIKDRGMGLSLPAR